MNRIQVYDGPNDTSVLIGELFGTQNHKVVKSISSSRNFLYIKFQSKFDTYETVEFVASIKHNKINSYCKSWLDLTNNILMSPSHANINCSWLITKQLRSYIALEFSYIEVKSMNIDCYLYKYIMHFFEIA